MNLPGNLCIHALFVIFEAVLELGVVSLHDFDSVPLVIIGGLVTLNLILGILNTRLELLLLVVELVLESQEMLIQRNSISQKRFIAASLILLVHFLVLQQLDGGLHRRDLLVQVEDDLIMDGTLLSVHLFPSSHLLNFVSSRCQVGVTLVLIVNDGACSSLINIIVSRCKLGIACCGTTTVATS